MGHCQEMRRLHSRTHLQLGTHLWWPDGHSAATLTSIRVNRSSSEWHFVCLHGCYCFLFDYLGEKNKTTHLLLRVITHPLLCKCQKMCFHDTSAAFLCMDPCENPPHKNQNLLFINSYLRFLPSLAVSNTSYIEVILKFYPQLNSRSDENAAL